MSVSKLNCQSGHLRKGLFLSHVLDYSSAVVLFFRREWKGEESGFGKVVHLKVIVNDWRSNRWGRGEPSIRVSENEVRIKANVYLRALFAFETLNGLILSQQYIVTRKGSLFSRRGEQLVGERHLVFLLWWHWHFGECFCQRWSFDDSYCYALPDAGKMKSTFLMTLCGGCAGFFFSPVVPPHPLHWLLWVTWPSPALVTSFMIKKGQAMQGSDTVHLSFTQSQ